MPRIVQIAAAAATAAVRPRHLKAEPYTATGAAAVLHRQRAAHDIAKFVLNRLGQARQQRQTQPLRQLRALVAQPRQALQAPPVAGHEEFGPIFARVAAQKVLLTEQQRQAPIQQRRNGAGAQPVEAVAPQVGLQLAHQPRHLLADRSRRGAERSGVGFAVLGGHEARGLVAQQRRKKLRVCQRELWHAPQQQRGAPGGERVVVERKHRHAGVAAVRRLQCGDLPGVPCARFFSGEQGTLLPAVQPRRADPAVQATVLPEKQRRIGDDDEPLARRGVGQRVERQPAPGTTDLVTARHAAPSVVVGAVLKSKAENIDLHVELAQALCPQDAQIVVALRMYKHQVGWTQAGVAVARAGNAEVTERRLDGAPGIEQRPARIRLALFHRAFDVTLQLALDRRRDRQHQMLQVLDGRPRLQRHRPAAATARDEGQCRGNQQPDQRQPGGSQQNQRPQPWRSHLLVVTLGRKVAVDGDGVGACGSQRGEHGRQRRSTGLGGWRHDREGRPFRHWRPEQNADDDHRGEQCQRRKVPPAPQWRGQWQLPQYRVGFAAGLGRWRAHQIYLVSQRQLAPAIKHFVEQRLVDHRLAQRRPQPELQRLAGLRVGGDGSGAVAHHPRRVDGLARTHHEIRIAQHLEQLVQPGKARRRRQGIGQRVHGSGWTWGL